jgi:hypothetical protein
MWLERGDGWECVCVCVYVCVCVCLCMYVCVLMDLMANE